jgi:hypothetical protein
MCMDLISLFSPATINFLQALPGGVTVLRAKGYKLLEPPPIEPFKMYVRRSKQIRKPVDMRRVPPQQLAY